MRDILFGGKRADNGEWVEGGYSYCENDNTHYITIMGKDNISHICYQCEVIPETLSEYTGRKDTHGNKIFENHIVKSNFSGKARYYKVIFKDGAFGLTWFYNGVCRFRSFTSFIDSVQYEIVGNVFDNSELLEVEE